MLVVMNVILLVVLSVFVPTVQLFDKFVNGCVRPIVHSRYFVDVIFDVAIVWLVEYDDVFALLDQCFDVMGCVIDMRCCVQCVFETCKA